MSFGTWVAIAVVLYVIGSFIGSYRDHKREKLHQNKGSAR